MRSWLVIGGSGYIGRSLVNAIGLRFPLEKITVPKRSELRSVLSIPNQLVNLQSGRLNVVILAAAGVSGPMDTFDFDFPFIIYINQLSS